MMCQCGREMVQRQEKGEKYLHCPGCTRNYNPRKVVEPVTESSDDELFAGSLEDHL